MFARKKAQPEKKRRNHDLSQFGLTDIPDDFDPTGGLGGDDDNDSDLEAELAAITGGGGGKPKPKPKAKLLPASDLDRMIADSLKDVDDDEEVGDDDLNDADLLGELQNIAGDDIEDLSPQQATVESPEQQEEQAPPQLFLPTTTLDTVGIVKQRLEMYKQAEAQAKAAGDNTKARRFGRGLKTLTDLLKQANAGKAINVDDIPPEVSVKKPATPSEDNSPPGAAPSRPAPLPPTPAERSQENSPAEVVTPNKTESPATPQNDEKSALIENLRERQKAYKAAALQHKRTGDTANALQFLKVVKQFDVVVKMCEDGQQVDLSDMPPPPEDFLEFLAKMQAAAEAPAETPADIPEPAAVVVPTPPQEPTDTATNMLDALQQRLDKYKSVEDSAKAEGNSSKARRFGRIVKQYEDAIKQYKAGRPVVYDELPVPPGFGPLPTDSSAGANSVASTPSSSAGNSAAEPTTATSSAGPSTPAPPQRKPPAPPKPQHIDLTTRTSGNQVKNNLAEQQMKILLERQREFKVAAIEAKKAGDIEQAKEYLKIYKGFESLLNAASSGLPVDLNTLPLPPSQRENLEASFAIVGSEDCDANDDISDIGVRIEEQLVKQLMMCKNTRDHYKAMGDVANMNIFENLAITVQKDLDLVRYNKRKNFPLPKFHYENRSFNIVHCNTDLTDSEMEIVVVRGINYKVANPKDVDTYVKIELPLLNDELFKTKTTVIRDTDSPDYDQRFKVEIQRNSRQFQRIFKRHGVKFEVYSRGGFLRSDTLIGSINVKLQPLETKCDIHDTFDLMEGRRPVGGKMELKIRLRNPIVTKQIEKLSEKWLVLDS